jgi:predicted nucleotidyltransferase
MRLDKLNSELANWALAKPLFNRPWMYGSRVRGDHRLDSDLDIAIELDLTVTKSPDESSLFTTWALDTEGWAEEIGLITEFKVDLRLFAGDRTPTVNSGVTRSSILVYSKACK